jgi:hypothetical protein
VQILVVLTDIGTIKKRIMTKMKDYVTKKCAGFGILKIYIGSGPQNQGVKRSTVYRIQFRNTGVKITMLQILLRIVLIFA